MMILGILFIAGMAACHWEIISRTVALRTGSPVASLVASVVFVGGCMSTMFLVDWELETKAALLSFGAGTVFGAATRAIRRGARKFDSVVALGLVVILGALFFAL
jgi:hypothetical protein